MNEVTAFMRRIEDPACPECGTRGYLILPSRGNCQTCLALRLRYLNACFPNSGGSEHA